MGVKRRLPYDVEDRLLQWVDGNGAAVKVEYDSLGRADKRYLSTMGSQALSVMCTNETFAYDNLSRLDQFKTFQYVWPTGSGPAPTASLHVQVDWVKDALGRKTTEVFGFGDNGSHAPVVSKTFTSTWGFGTGKEDFGFRRGLGTSNGFTYAFTPDAIGRLSNASLTGNGLSGVALVDYRYAGSRPVNRQHRLWSGGSRFETTYTYDALRYLTQLETKYGTGIPADPVIFSQTLVRDLVGKILEDQQGLVGGTVGNKYSYGPFDRLQKAELGVSTFGSNPTVAKTIDYTLDNAQNRTSVTEKVGGTPTTTSYTVASNSNEYSSVGNSIYTHDGNGNLISDGFYYYVYDYLDRLSEVYVITYPAGATSSTSTRTAVYSHEIQKTRAGKPTKVTPSDAKRLLGVMRSRVQKELARLKSERSTIKNTKDLKISSAVNQELTSTVDDYVLEFVAWYGYDSFNRRVSKVSLYESAWYGYDGWRLLEEYDGGGVGSVSYFDGNGIDEHLGMAKHDPNSQNPEYYSFAQDQIGNVTRVIDSVGAVIARFEYDPFGNRTLVSGTPGFNMACGFTGRYHDIETDLIYFRNRYYSPGLGRFVTSDPVGIWRDALNRGNGLAFGGNRGVVAQDPFGHETRIYYVWDKTSTSEPATLSDARRDVLTAIGERNGSQGGKYSLLDLDLGYSLDDENQIQHDPNTFGTSVGRNNMKVGDETEEPDVIICLHGTQEIGDGGLRVGVNTGRNGTADDLADIVDMIKKDLNGRKPRRVLLISCFAALGWGTGLRKGNRDRECDAAVPTFQELLFPIIHAYEGLIYMGRTGNTRRGKLFMDHLLLDEYDILNPELGPPDSIDLDNPWGAAVPIGAITFGEQLALGIG